MRVEFRENFPKQTEIQRARNNNKSPRKCLPVIITAVSYLNTLPFIYGIEQAAPELRGGLSLQIPALCADSVINGRTDIGLIPVAAIPLITTDYQIITDYCIGAQGPVHSVLLLSNSPIEEIHTIHLDSHSRTSVQLVRVLCREWWHISPLWVEQADSMRPIEKGEAVVAIGDKAFELVERYTYRYDLAEHWGLLTGQPFVFAAWVALTQKGLNAAPTLNRALKYGVEHIADSITKTENRSQDFDFTHAYNYLTYSIKFDLDSQKRHSMQLFWEKIITPG